MSDLINRQDAIDALERAEALTRAFGYHNVIDTIRELPSAEPEQTVELRRCTKMGWAFCDGNCENCRTYATSCIQVQPERKRGEWEVIDAEEPRRYGCSHCHILSWNMSNFCPNCGADMRGEDDV